ncbi:hypothetical protein [Spiroplasma endosymbiont of Virgichneumon dumeticola]|uniref:hypothetical protein n=1 Tax=Spiroplasma endosymbiont of Virgichneumon dumeticola TaxID=3139323 RepID=UPI0035C91AB3
MKNETKKQIDKIEWYENIKIRNYEFELFEYQVNTLLDIVREMLKANKRVNND